MNTFHAAATALAFSLVSSAVWTTVAEARPQSGNNLKQMTIGMHHAGAEGQKRLRCEPARTAAARMQCQNNLKQIGVALHDSRVDKLIRIQTTPSVKCKRIEYAYACLSSDPWKLTRVNCRHGATEATCCQGARTTATNSCAAAWDAAKKSGETWFPGPFICKCIEQGSTRLRVKPKERLRRIPR